MTAPLARMQSAKVPYPVADADPGHVITVEDTTATRQLVRIQSFMN